MKKNNNLSSSLQEVYYLQKEKTQLDGPLEKGIIIREWKWFDSHVILFRRQTDGEGEGILYKLGEEGSSLLTGLQWDQFVDDLDHYLYLHDQS